MANAVSDWFASGKGALTRGTGGPMAVMRMLRIVALVAWPVSWYLIWKEIFVWRHMTKSLRFQVPEPAAGRDDVSRPGVPVRLLRAVAVASPIVCVLGFAVEAWRPAQLRRAGSGGSDRGRRRG